MMLRDNGPDTSFEEDVKALGINHLFEDAAQPKPPAPKADTETDSDEDEDDVAEGENPFAKKDDAGKKPNPFAKKKDDAAADKKDDHKEPDGDEDADGDEPDDAEESEETEHDAEGSDFTETDEASALDGLCDEDEKLDAAVDVIGSFYTALNESEGASVDRDALIGVVEAYEYLADVTGLLDEASKRFHFKGGKKVHVTKGMKKAKRMEKSAAGHAGPAMKRFKITAAGKRVPKTAAEMKAEKKAGRGLAMGKAHRGSGAAHAAKFGKKGRKLAGLSSDIEQEGSPITELVDNLNALKEAVQSNVDYRGQADELKEGFNSIGETASTWMSSIAEEVKKSVAEDENFDAENDPRVMMGRHLDGIATNAAEIMSKIDEGEADLTDAASDLQNLSADLNDAAEAMKEIA